MEINWLLETMSDDRILATAGMVFLAAAIITYQLLAIKSSLGNGIAEFCLAISIPLVVVILLTPAIWRGSLEGSDLNLIKAGVLASTVLTTVLLYVMCRKIQTLTHEQR